MKRFTALFILGVTLALGLLAGRADAAPLTGATNIGATSNNSCAVVAGGKVRCWGENLSGQIGDGTAGTDRHVGTLVLNTDGTQLTGATQVTVGIEFACARLSTKQVRCWGQNGSGQLGDGSTDAATRAVVVRNSSDSGPLTNVTQIDAGGSHVCARRTDGSARCWGVNAFGQLGNDQDTNGSPLPTSVSNVAGTGPLTGVVQVVSGIQHSCARLENEQVRCWGGDFQGQVGNGGGTGEYHRPVAVRQVDGTGNIGNVSSIAAGDHTACAVLGNGQARCWGDGGQGELGEQDDADRQLPVIVEDPGANVISSLDNVALTGVAQVATGGDHTCFRLTNGQLRCAGQNTDGQLGTDQAGTGVALPVRNASDTGVLTDVVQVTAGGDHTCARLGTGAVFCWGEDASGQVGNGAGLADVELPTLVQSA